MGRWPPDLQMQQHIIRQICHLHLHWRRIWYVRGRLNELPKNDIRGGGDGGSVRLSVQSKDADQSCGMEMQVVNHRFHSENRGNVRMAKVNRDNNTC